MEYSIIYSDRRTISLTVKDGKLTVRAPRGASKKRLEQAIEDNIGWIEKKLSESKEKMKTEAALTGEDIKRLKKEAKEYFVSRTEEISKITGLKYRSVKITSAKTRFGSCSSAGNVC